MPFDWAAQRRNMSRVYTRGLQSRAAFFQQQLEGPRQFVNFDPSVETKVNLIAQRVATGNGWADGPHQVVSTWVVAVGFYGEDGVGGIAAYFKSGVCCWYTGTTLPDYLNFLYAGSKGKYVHAFLYHRSYVKISPQPWVQNQMSAREIALQNQDRIDALQRQAERKMARQQKKHSAAIDRYNAAREADIGRFGKQI